MILGDNIYQRAALSAGNIFSGNLDAATQALFSPMALSPDELKSLQDKFTGGGKHAENPIIKTALSLASNPILWIGIALAVGPWGRVRDIKNLSAVMQEGKAYMREVHPFMRALTSPFTSLRDLWHTGVIDKMLKVVKDTAEFQARHNDEWQGLVRAAQSSLGRQLSDRERRMVGAYLEGWHLPKAPIQQAGGGYPKILGEAPLAPGLEKRMEPAVLKLSQGLRGLLDKAGGEVLLDKEGEVLADFANKGVEWVGMGYAPRLTQRTGLEAFLQGTARVTTKYRRNLRNMGPMSGRAKSTHVRKGWSVPLEADVDLIQDVLTPEAYNGLKRIGVSSRDFFKQRLEGYTEGLRAIQAGEPVRDASVSIHNITEGMREELKHWGGSPDLAEPIVAHLRHKLEVDPGSVPVFIETLAERVGPARFTMDPYKYVPRYIRTMGPTYAWITKEGGSVLEEIFSEESKYGYVVKGWQRDMYQENLKPALKGMLTPKEFARRAWFEDSKLKAVEWLKSESPAIRMIPKGTRDWVLKGLEGGLSEQTVGGKIASLLYVSSLGANLSPVYKNLFQNFITTMNYTGAGNMAKGMGVVAGKLGDLSEEMGKGTPFNKAFKVAFPEYFEQFGYEHMLKAMAHGDIAKEATTATSVAKGAYEKIATGMMAPFAGSEKLNRLWSFYSSYGAAQEAGLSIGESGKIARNLTLLTQFGGGALGIPTAIRNLPVPLRQFSHFPLRYLEWLYGSMAFHPETTKISTGVIGRTMASSAGLYEIFKNLVGLDTANALAFGALPFPTYDKAALFPFPIVPPAVGIAAEASKAVVTGQFDQVPGKLGAAVVPGGIAVRRAWRTWAPKYVGYDQPTPDGKYPVYNKDGALLMYETPMQIVLRGLGLRPSAIEQEAATVRWLLGQRDKLRDFRRRYVEAVANGDMEQAQKIQNEFKKKFPSLGEIQIKRSDLQAVRNRQQLTRVQRILRGFPKEYQPIFESAASLGAVGHLAQSIDATGAPGFTF
jgi:hypothetical protein